MRLTDQTIRSLPYEDGQRDYPDDIVRGIFVRVGRRTKTFMVTTRSGGNRFRESLGYFPELGLAKARSIARDKLATARLAKDELPSTTLTDALDTFYRIRGAEQRPSTRARCQYLLDKYVRDALGSQKLEAIKLTHLAPILDDIESLAVRRNTFAFLQAFFSWSYRRGYIDTVPTARLERPPELRSRDRVLSVDELARIWHACPPNDYGTIVKLCMLTGQRIGQWMHVKPEYVTGDLITWPGEAMKEGKLHTLPLTPLAAELLKGAPFNWKMDGNYKTRLDKASRVTQWRHHDLRRTWATVAAEELDATPHVIEGVLAHASGNPISRVYNRAKYLQPMREALDAFETWLIHGAQLPAARHGAYSGNGR